MGGGSEDNIQRHYKGEKEGWTVRHDSEFHPGSGSGEADREGEGGREGASGTMERGTLLPRVRHSVPDSAPGSHEWGGERVRGTRMQEGEGRGAGSDRRDNRDEDDRGIIGTVILPAERLY